MKEYKPTGYELGLKDLYLSNEVFKFYCDYYKGAKIERFMFLDDFVDWANGGQYKRHTGAYRKRCEGWIESAKNIESYMKVLNISINKAFSCWYYCGWKGFDDCGLTKSELEKYLVYGNDYIRVSKFRCSARPYIRKYLKLHPDARKVDVIRDTGLSSTTVYKWYDIAKNDLGL